MEIHFCKVFSLGDLVCNFFSGVQWLFFLVDLSWLTALEKNRNRIAGAYKTFYEVTQIRIFLTFSYSAVLSLVS